MMTDIFRKYAPSKLRYLNRSVELMWPNVPPSVIKWVKMTWYLVCVRIAEAREASVHFVGCVCGCVCVACVCAAPGGYNGGNKWSGRKM